MGTGQPFPSFTDFQATFAPSNNNLQCLSVLSLCMLITSVCLALKRWQYFAQLRSIVDYYSHLGAIYVRFSCSDVHFWRPFQISIELLKFITGSEVEKNKGNMSHSDSMMNNSIYFVISVSPLLASKSSMNFHNFKTQPVKGQSRVFNPLHSSRAVAKAQKNTLGSKGKHVW